MRHLGNIFALDRDDPQSVDMELGANLSRLPKTVSVSTHLNGQSDIVALMVLEHQSRIHNLITRANYESRQAAYLDKSMNEALGRGADYVSESTVRRIASVGDSLIAGLLFADETVLTSPVTGTSGFADHFSARGPTDSRGRSFYQLDLKRRMFRWPLSYLVLSEHFKRSSRFRFELREKRIVRDLTGPETASQGSSFGQCRTIGYCGNVARVKARMDGQ